MQQEFQWSSNKSLPANLHRQNPCMASGIIIIPYWTTREQINDVMLKTLFTYAKSFHRSFRMKHLIFLTSHFILFTHQKRVKPRRNQWGFRFQNMGPSATIISGPSYIVSRSVSGIYTHERGVIELGKTKATTNFSIESSLWQNT